jgi:hypothetical protein
MDFASTRVPPFPPYISLSRYIGQGFKTSLIGSVQGEIRGGQIDGGIVVDTLAYAPTSNLTISGGQFNASMGDWLLHFSDDTIFDRAPSQLSIWGGQFGYHEAGLGLLIDHNVNFDVHGRDLVFANGWLTGYLLDGSWFSNNLTFGAGWTGTFTIHNVPEPGTMGLLLLSIVGALGLRRSPMHG